MTQQPARTNLTEPAEEVLLFPQGFRFGAATSAHQVEGGTTNNNWARWTTDHPQPGRRPIKGPDHWNTFDQDLSLMADLGLDIYRFSVEWSRIEPLPGHIDTLALERYRSWCLALRASGIRPMVTLHHFTEPLWLTDLGGFANSASIEHFGAFARRVVAALADVVDLWVTINEPVGYATLGWALGEWPPGRTSYSEATAVLQNLLTAHARAYEIIHADARWNRRGRPWVGIAHALIPFTPDRRWAPLDHFAARALHGACNRSVWQALHRGKATLFLPDLTVRTLQNVRWVGTQDYLGVNNYFTLRATGRLLGSDHISTTFPPGFPRSDLGWSLEPSSLRAAVELAKPYRLPVIVTEHGCCDNQVPDHRRRRHLLASLRELRDATVAGAPIHAYIHWSLLDNYEWNQGLDARFGLYRVDWLTGERTLTSAGAAYQHLIAANRDGHHGPTDRPTVSLDNRLEDRGHDRA